LQEIFYGVVLLLVVITMVVPHGFPLSEFQIKSKFIMSLYMNQYIKTRNLKINQNMNNAQFKNEKKILVYADDKDDEDDDDKDRFLICSMDVTFHKENNDNTCTRSEPEQKTKSEHEHGQYQSNHVNAMESLTYKQTRTIRYNIAYMFNNSIKLQLNENDKLILVMPNNATIGTLYDYYYQTHLLCDLLVLQSSPPVLLHIELHPTIKNKCIVYIYMYRKELDKVVNKVSMVPEIIQFTLRRYGTATCTIRENAFTTREFCPQYVTQPRATTPTNIMLPFQQRTILWMQHNETLSLMSNEEHPDGHDRDDDGDGDGDGEHILVTKDIQLVYRIHPNNMVSILKYGPMPLSKGTGSSGCSVPALVHRRRLKVIKHYSGKSTILVHFLLSHQNNLDDKTVIWSHRSLVDKFTQAAIKYGLSNITSYCIKEFESVNTLKGHEWERCSVPNRIVVMIRYSDLKKDVNNILLSTLDSWLSFCHVYLVIHDYHDLYIIERSTNHGIGDGSSSVFNNNTTIESFDTAFDPDSEVINIDLTHHRVEMNAIETFQYRDHLIRHNYNIIDTSPVDKYITFASHQQSHATRSELCPVCMSTMTTIPNTVQHQSSLPMTNINIAPRMVSCITRCNHRICYKCCNTLFEEQMTNVLNTNRYIKCPICRHELYPADVTIECLDEQDILLDSCWSSRIRKLIDILQDNPTKEYLIITKYPNMFSYIESYLDKCNIGFSRLVQDNDDGAVGASSCMDIEMDTNRILIWKFDPNFKSILAKMTRNRHDLTIIMVDGHHNVLNNTTMEILYKYNGLEIPWINRLPFKNLIQYIASTVCYFRQIIPTKFISLSLNNSFE
jgi:hypothetical protein